jgi:hypothetical protein
MLLFLLLVAIATTAIPVSRMKTGDYFSPAAVVLTAWCGSLALYSLFLLRYRLLRPETIVFISAALALLVGGIVLGTMAVRRRGSRQVPTRIQRRVQAPELWLTVYSIIGLLGIVWYVFNVGRTIGIRAFLDSPAQIRVALVKYTFPTEFLFFEFFCMTAPLLAFTLLVTEHRLKIWAWIGPILCTLATWTMTDRTQFFTVLLTSYLIYTYANGGRLSLRRLLVSMVVVAVLLVANFSLVGWWLGKTAKNVGVEIVVPQVALPSMFGGRKSSAVPRPPPSAEGGSWTRIGQTVSTYFSSSGAWIGETVSTYLRRSGALYFYTTASYPALDLLLRDGPSYTLGAHTFFPILRLPERLGLLPFALPSPIGPYRDISSDSKVQPMSFNGYTFLYYPFEDFGTVGALLYALAIGFGCGAVYGLLDSGRQDGRVLILMGAASMSLALSIFVNKFNNTATWYVVTFALLPFALGAKRVSAVEAAGDPATRKRTG